MVGALLCAPLGRRPVYAALCLLSMASMVAFYRLNSEYNTAFLLSAGLLGMISASFYGWLPLYLPELFPTRVRAAGQGFCYNFGRSLAAIGVLVVNFGINLKGEYARASAIVVLVYLVGMVLVWFAPETKGQPLPS